MKLYEPFTAGTLPRLDRIIVAGLLLLLAALAGAFTVHQAILMDEMEAAMWRDMNMSMNGMEPSWTPVDAAVHHVVGNDGGDDGAGREPNGRRVRHHQQPA